MKFLNSLGYDPDAMDFEDFYELEYAKFNQLPTGTGGTFSRRPGKFLVIFSGHGSWNPDDGFIQVPKGARFVAFTEHMKTLSDGLGGKIESLGSLLGTLPQPDSEFAQYMNMPNYTLHPPYDPPLNIQRLTNNAQRNSNIWQIVLNRTSPSVTLKKLYPWIEKRLPDKIVRNGIDYFWACCRAVDFKREVGGEAIGVNAMQR